MQFCDELKIKNFTNISADNDLKAPIDKEEWLIRFLRPTKYYPESAYKLVCYINIIRLYVIIVLTFIMHLCWQIKQYYQFKVKHSNIYKDLTPRTEKNIFDHDILHVLPKRDQGGRRILVIELGSKLVTYSVDLWTKSVLLNRFWSRPGWVSFNYYFLDSCRTIIVVWVWINGYWVYRYI